MKISRTAVLTTALGGVLTAVILGVLELVFGWFDLF